MKVIDMEFFIFLFYFTSIFCYWILRDAIHSIFTAHVGHKRKYRMIKSRHTIWERILMSYIRQYLKTHIKLYDFLMVIHYTYLAILLISFILLPMIIVMGVPEKTLYRVYYTKLILLDFPLMIFGLLFTTHNPDPNCGGAVWRFEIKKRRV